MLEIIRKLKELMGGSNKYIRYLEANQVFQSAKKHSEEVTDVYELAQTKKNKRKLDKAKVLESKAAQERYEAEKSFYNTDLGLFLGLAVNLDTLQKPKPLYLKWENLVNHMVIYGTTRYGKSRLLAAIKRQIIAKGDNVIFIDPKQGKGEIISWTLESAYENNRIEDVRYYNPLYPELTDYLNPAFGMKDEELMSAVVSLMKGSSSGTSQSEQFFLGVAQDTMMAMLKCLSYLEETHDSSGEIKKKKLKEEILNYIKLTEMRGHTLRDYDVSSNVIEPDVSERLMSQQDIAVENAEDMMYNRTFITFKDILHYSAFDQLEYLYNTVYMTETPTSISREQYDELERLRSDALLAMRGVLDAGKESYDKTAKGLRSLLSGLSIGRIGKTFCTIRINPIVQHLTSKNKGFIGVFQTNPLKFNTTSEVMTKILLKSLESMFGLISGTGRLNNKKLFVIIDEGEAVLAPGIQGLLNKIGGVGGTIILATQSGADFDYKLQPVLARVAKDSINTTIIMKPNDAKSRIEQSEFLGTIRQMKTQYMADSGGLSGRSTNMMEEELIVSPTRIDKLRVGEGYIKHYGERYKAIFPYVNDPAVTLVMPTLEEEEMYALANQFEHEATSEPAEHKSMSASLSIKEELYV